jgi:hypothetical protein
MQYREHTRKEQVEEAYLHRQDLLTATKRAFGRNCGLEMSTENQTSSLEVCT